jgi:hypothetical protein
MPSYSHTSSWNFAHLSSHCYKNYNNNDYSSHNNRLGQLFCASQHWYTTIRSNSSSRASSLLAAMRKQHKQDYQSNNSNSNSRNKYLLYVTNSRTNTNDTPTAEHSTQQQQQLQQQLLELLFLALLVLLTIGAASNLYPDDNLIHADASELFQDILAASYINIHEMRQYDTQQLLEQCDKLIANKEQIRDALEKSIFHTFFWRLLYTKAMCHYIIDQEADAIAVLEELLRAVKDWDEADPFLADVHA